ncbi:type VI secretion protein [Burkholderia pyrrocinia]|uniref:GPW/gp25 family protein n=1 Tax=Burkholderia stagnalis TaxID=1503054 RepID=UPI00075846A0|nr:GPW/gp25 family protein [Burkholderia stagnalis]KVN35067.1 type VI secretion protein [Burkholderia pyrrocinia]WGS47480.1 GPW/gp25 family protein [Burkholderia sp. JSH-S8]
MSAHPLYNKLSRRFRRDSLREVVGHDLVELMNCALRGGRIGVSGSSPVAYSVLNYGCPPLQVSGSTQIDPVHTATHICEVLRRFEPRVDSTRTRVQPRAGGAKHAPQTMYFDILTTARDDGAEIRVSLALDYLSGFFSLVSD